MPSVKHAMGWLTSMFRLFVCAVLLVALVHFSGCAPHKPLQPKPSVTDIHAAAATGDVALVRGLLERNPALLEQPDERGRTPLHAAAAAGQEAVVQALLTAGANVSAKDKENTAETVDERVVREEGPFTAASALAGGVDRALRAWGGETPLSCAARNGHTRVVALLIGKGADVNVRDALGRSPLYHAAGAGATKVMQLLLSNGAHVNAEPAGDTPLYAATAGGRVDAARLLLSSGANANVHRDTSDTPLHMAAWAGHSDLARLLLSEGARVNVKTGRDQETPLHYAAATGQTEVAQLLLAAGANVNAKSEWGDTPLHVAAQESQAKIARLLVARGANPNARNKDAGDTPLHAAARRAGVLPGPTELLERRPLTDAQAAALEVYKVLRAAGANAKVRNGVGYTPSEMAPRFEMEYALSRPVHRRPASGR